MVFSSGEARQTVSIPIGDDALIEGDETIALAFGDLPTGVTLGTNSTTTVTITDTDTALFGFAIDDGEVGEGATVALTLTLDGDDTFATAQTIDLTFPSSAATARVDFTVADSHLQTLTAPYALTFPAASNSVAATISMVNDAEEEGDETIVVSALHGAASPGVKVITILASHAVPLATNNPPVFGEGRTAPRAIAENTGPNRNIGNPLAATDIDPGDTLSYSLGGADGDFFTIVPTSGQLRTRSGVTYDHEARARYEVTVSVSDDDATASIDVTIAVTDVDEPPDAPDAPTVTSSAASPLTSLQVTWMALATPGRPAVRNYDLRYKLATEAAFINGPQGVSGTSATIDDLTPAFTYEVQVRAGNDEGDGSWSASQSAETAVLPVVTLVLSRSSIPENRRMSTMTATVSPASPTPFTLNIWAAAFPPFPGQFETSANNILSFAANETQSTGEVVITGLVPAVVNVAGAVSPADVLVTRPATVQLRITEVAPPVTVVTRPPVTGGGGGGGGFGSAPVAPGFADGFRTSRSVAENARPGDAVGGPVSATHPDELEIAYSLSGTDAASFAVDEETGQVRVKEGVELTLGRTYTVNLTATGSAGFGAIIIVMIEVTKASFSPYDSNGNDRIDREEVLSAVSDYFKGLLDKDEVIELIKLYFQGGG